MPCPHKGVYLNQHGSYEAILYVSARHPEEQGYNKLVVLPDEYGDGTYWVSNEFQQEIIMGFLEMSKIDLGCFDFHDQLDHPERFLKYRETNNGMLYEAGMDLTTDHTLVMYIMHVKTGGKRVVLCYGLKTTGANAREHAGDRGRPDTREYIVRAVDDAWTRSDFGPDDGRVARRSDHAWADGRAAGQLEHGRGRGHSRGGGRTR